MTKPTLACIAGYLELLNRQRDRRVRVPDLVALVKENIAPVHGEELGAEQFEALVRGYEDAVLPINCLEGLGRRGRAGHGRRVEDADASRGPPPMEFATPLAKQRRGAHDQRRRSVQPRVPKAAEERDRLDRLAQAHFVADNPAIIFCIRKGK